MEAISKRKNMSPKFQPAIAANKRENLSCGLEEIILLRELDKKFTHANPKVGKCTIESCNNHATHWLTRRNVDYCQSDMVCNHHANIWMQVKDLICDRSLNRN
jgi:hypothetical protein